MSVSCVLSGILGLEDCVLFVRTGMMEFFIDALGLLHVLILLNLSEIDDCAALGVTVVSVVDELVVFDPECQHLYLSLET